MKVRELWRYPVKSMAGERIKRAAVGENGIPGDRAWALRQNGNTRNAKKFPQLMALRARYDKEPLPGEVPPPVITLEDGTVFTADDPAAASRISQIVGAQVSISGLAPLEDRAFYKRREKRTMEESRAIFGLLDDEPFPDVSRFPRQLAEFSTPPGTFFDCFPLLVMTTSSLDALQSFAPQSNIDPRRFRPNILIESDSIGFVENTWAGKTLKIGTAILSATLPCPRCVMTTIGFHDLPRDTSIMRALVKATRQEFGVYAEVSSEGTISEGDEVVVY
jgi:uncharacterized protein YcbX